MRRLSRKSRQIIRKGSALVISAGIGAGAGLTTAGTLSMLAPAEAAGALLGIGTVAGAVLFPASVMSAYIYGNMKKQQKAKEKMINSYMNKYHVSHDAAKYKIDTALNKLFSNKRIVTTKQVANPKGSLFTYDKKVVK